MKLEKLVGDRFKEKPADCVIDSHALMLRGGYMKQVANGIYSSYLPLTRITRKIEQIIREEMDALDGQEVKFPVVLPASLWEQSGRYQAIGSELVRFADRNKTPLVLGMTHEEAAVQLVREYGQSHTKYPFMVYQLQTKFRDEARPRGGLIRVREFTMKDAYSFHTSQADLEAYYERCLQAYERIYSRVGIPQVVAVASDSGMMGGSVSHEFMLLTPIGEDSIAICGDCGYKANMEATHVEGGLCPRCGKPAITISRGVEVGNIFQLGAKYTRAMGMTYLDREGNPQNPVMGCYGIGVGRLAASVCQACHDDFGPIWPLAIAPWQVHICAVRADNPQVRQAADQLYQALQGRGMEVLYDDRVVTAGVMFSDADLLGIPYRVIVSPRNLDAHCCEIVARDGSFSEKIPLEGAQARLMALLHG